MVRSSLAAPFGLHDMYQPDFTHAAHASRGRLDRVYTNMHVSEQLDGEGHFPCPDALAQDEVVKACRTAWGAADLRSAQQTRDAFLGTTTG